MLHELKLGLQRYWRWTSAGPKWHWAAGIGGPLLALFILTGAVGGSEEELPGEDAPVAQADADNRFDGPRAPLSVPAMESTAPAAPTPQPTRDVVAVPTATPSPVPTRVPTVAPTAIPAAQPVVISGRGQFATNAITLPSSISSATFTHNGASNFIVKAYIGNTPDLLVNEIGLYSGERLIASTSPVILDIEADGAWTVTISTVGSQASPAFQGKGDSVSGLFTPPTTGPWQISHTGSRNFIVWLRCAGGDTLVQNEIGAASGSRVVTFKQGPCLWEVEADGSWSLTPR